MPSPRSPSMPTKRQIEEAYLTARNLCPGIRIKGVGPEGVTFEYPEKGTGNDEWYGTPFSSDAS